MCVSDERQEPTLRLEGVDEASLSAFFALRDLMRANSQVVAKRFAAKGAHMGQAGCLRVLSHNDGITQREMAEILCISRPSITEMLKAVEKTGAIVRKPDEADQRLTRVYLTDKGRAIAAELRGVLADYILETIGRMPEDDRRELARLLGDLNGLIVAASSTDGEADAG